MKKSLNKLSIILLLVLATFLGSNTDTVEHSEAYYGNWKIQSQTCTIITYVRKINAWDGGREGETISRTVQEGTRRRCTDGGGLCFWGSNCSAN